MSSSLFKQENTILSLFKDKAYSIDLTAKEEVGEQKIGREGGLRDVCLQAAQNKYNKKMQFQP